MSESAVRAYAAEKRFAAALLSRWLAQPPADRDALLALARFKTTASAGAWRSLKDYVGALKENQTAIYCTRDSGLEG